MSHSSGIADMIWYTDCSIRVYYFNPTASRDKSNISAQGRPNLR